MSYPLDTPLASSTMDDLPQMESSSMDEILSGFRITALALVTKDDERSGLMLIIGAIYNKVK